MQRLDNVEVTGYGKGALTAYKKIHANYCVKVEWDVDGLKCKFKRLMKQFDATKTQVQPFFSRVVTILTNFVHQH